MPKTKAQVPGVVIACPLCKQLPSDRDAILFRARLPEKVSSDLFSARRLPDRIHYQLVKCAHDGLVRSTPVFDQRSVSKWYQRSQVTYTHVVAHLMETYLKALAPVLEKLPPTAPILEVGCGSGFMLTALQQRGFKEVYGVEPSLAAVQQAPGFVQKRIWNQPVSRSVLQKKKWQLIFLLQTFDHLAEPEVFLEQCYDSLAPGGFVVSFHHDVEAWPVKVLGDWHPIIDIEHHFLYSAATTISLFEASGLVVESISKPTNYVSLYHLVWLMPLPVSLKSFMLDMLKDMPGLNRKIGVKLGNLCVIGRKPQVIKETR